MVTNLSKVVVRARKQIILLASALAVSCCFMSSAQALASSQISQVYFFGDSLSDSGFNDLWSFPTPLPAGKAPTFTTFGGYVWAQYVARDLKGFALPVYPGPSPADTITNNSITVVPGFVSGTLHGVDYAAAGSTTNSIGLNETWAPSLTQQISYYLATHGQAADPNAVYFIWSGANDLLTLLSGATLPSQLQLLLAANAAAINIANEVEQLARSGATRVVVFTLPNLGITPLINQVAAANNLPTLPSSMTTLTFSFNSMLNTQLGNVIKKYGTKILYEDVYDLLDNVVLATQAGQPYNISGQSFQFVNYTTPACATVQSAIYCPNGAPNNYVFADVLHPTSLAHRILSLQVEADIQGWQ